MLKKLITSFLIVLGFASFFSNQQTVSASEDETISEEELQTILIETVDSETLDVMEKLDNYLIKDSEGEITFDSMSAVEQGESDLFLSVGNAYNQFGEGSTKISDSTIELYGWPKITLYGNFCGPAGKNGSDFSKSAIDNLDSACKAHDRCYSPGKSDKTTNRSCNLAFMKKLLPVIQTSSKLSKKHIVAVAAYKYFEGRL